MTTYTLPEFFKLMKPRRGRDRALIRKCITGLGLYAAQQARADPATPKIAELRGLIENLACYWGLDNVDGDPSAGPAILKEEFLDPFDARIQAVRSGVDIQADILAICRPYVIYGLYRYGADMAVSMGAMAKDEILSIAGLMKEIAAAWGCESATLDNLISDLETDAPLLEVPEPDAMGELP